MICSTCNIEKDTTDFRKSRKKCRSCENLNRKERYNLNREKELEQKKDYIRNNQEKVKESRKRYKSKKTIERKLLDSLSGRIRSCLFKNKKPRDNLKFLGCSIDELKKWFEFLFDNTMTWNNYGHVWHIDHIKPCSSFDFKNEEEVLLCFHWTNIRPCLKIENLTKSNKVINDIIELYKKKSIEYKKTLNQTENIIL
jgi:hypothetical protein